MYIFKIKDKDNRIIHLTKIHLTKERWKHITKEHPEIKDIDDIRNALLTAQIIKRSFYDENVRWFHLYNKNRKRYLMVAVKHKKPKGFLVPKSSTF